MHVRVSYIYKHSNTYTYADTAAVASILVSNLTKK